MSAAPTRVVVIGADAAGMSAAHQALRTARTTGRELAVTVLDRLDFSVGTGVASDPALPPLTSLEAPPVDPFTLNSEKVIQMMTDAGIL